VAAMPDLQSLMESKGEPTGRHGRNSLWYLRPVPIMFEVARL
jgi:hypothetical protein